VTKNLIEFRAKGLTTSFGAVGGVFYQQIFISGLRSLARQPLEPMASHLKIAIF
jgi:hypothetical protein